MPWEISLVSIIFWKVIRRTGRSRTTAGNGTGADDKYQRGSWEAISKRRGTEPKLERLSELNALLNMDEREDTETEQSESKEKEERPARSSIHEKHRFIKKRVSGKVKLAAK